MKARESGRRQPMRKRTRKAEINDPVPESEPHEGTDMELEKARLISLALEFGFEEDSARKCLDGLIQLYGKT